MKKIIFILALVGLAAPVWSGPRVGLGSAVARQSGAVIKTEQDKVAASNLPVCGETPYSVSPIDPAIPFNMEPLGHMSGAGHLFPTDHIYYIILKPINTVETTTVYAPADMQIYEVASLEYLNAVPPFTDYSLRFSPCQGLKGTFGHVAELSSTLAQAVGAVDQNCFVYSDGSVRYCSEQVAISVEAGDVLGTVMGRVGSAIYGLDLGAYDYRKAALAFLDPVRAYGQYLYTQCPIDEYEEPIKSNLLARMGNYNGTILRTEEPVCGTILEDVAATAQGLWYVFGTPLVPVESVAPHLALVHDNVTPSTAVFSIGTTLAQNGIGAQQYYFNPTTSGLVNLDFDLVTSNNNVYCYDSFSNLLNTILLIQMPTSTTLKIENQTAASCGSGPWTFTNNAVLFER